MYLDFYGLKEFPFNITPDPRFLYYSKRHRESFEALLYGVEQRKGFIELIGEVGCGKTTLCRALLSSLPNTVDTALVLNPSVTESQLLRAILEDFGLAPNGRDRLGHIQQLNRFLLAQANAGRNVVLIIDEAQDLLPGVLEQIRLLNNLETDRYKLMQIILAGQPELKKRLNRDNLRQLRQRIMVRCKLELLDEEETSLYIAHRIQVAGASIVGFDRGAVRLIYKQSKGTPRIINTICDNALLAGYVEGSATINASHVKKALAELGDL